jgi:hypothetical protein
VTPDKNFLTMGFVLKDLALFPAPPLSAVELPHAHLAGIGLLLPDVPAIIFSKKTRTAKERATDGADPPGSL